MTAGGAPRDARREALIDSAADVLLAQGIAAAALRPIARAAGTSDRMLLYYFPDKPALLAAAMERVAARMEASLAAVPAQPMPPTILQEMLLARIADPALGPFFALALDMAAQAARGDAFWAGVGHDVVQRFRRFIADRLDLPEAERPPAARAILARIEGEVVLRALRSA